MITESALPSSQVNLSTITSFFRYIMTYTCWKFPVLGSIRKLPIAQQFSPSPQNFWDFCEISKSQVYFSSWSFCNESVRSWPRCAGTLKHHCSPPPPSPHPCTCTPSQQHLLIATCWLDVYVNTIARSLQRYVCNHFCNSLSSKDPCCDPLSTRFSKLRET